VIQFIVMAYQIRLPSAAACANPSPYDLINRSPKPPRHPYSVLIVLNRLSRDAPESCLNSVLFNVITSRQKRSIAYNHACESRVIPKSPAKRFPFACARDVASDETCYGFQEALKSFPRRKAQN